jgi:phosphodiesterase/alkaline phosphatase D-like protein
MYHISSGCSVVQRSVRYLAHESPAAIFILTVAVSVNAIALGQASTLPNGVACSNVRQTSAVLWAHSTAVGCTTFEHSHSADFSTVGGHEVVAVIDPNKPVKVEIAGLIPATQYYYRFTDAQNNTAYGEFRTPSTVGMTVGLHFGASGDWQQPPPFPSLSNVAVSNLDFFIKLGDSIYADSESPALPGIHQARTLEHFRIKHNENLSWRFGLNIMASLHASTSILATIDDHEIVDNFAGGTAPGQSQDAPDVHPLEPPLFTEAVDFVNETQVYKDAMRAFQEYHPITNELWNVPDDPRMHQKPKFYYKAAYASDAAVLLLDTRSFRDAPLPPVHDPFDSNEVATFVASTLTPGRTILGRAQMENLKSSLLEVQCTGITWKFVVVPEPIQNFGIINAEYRFEGYAAERTELLKFIHDSSINNVVFIAGDFHGTIVNNLAYQELPADPCSAYELTSTPVNAFEVVTGPVAFFDSLLGPSIVKLASDAGVLSPFLKAFYDSLPVRVDTDSITNDKDDFIKALVDAQLEPLAYDPIGLNSNLSAADGLIDAELIQGDYLACHTYGWAEFEIEADTQDLLITVYGIHAYSESDLLSDPNSVLKQDPRIVSQFTVHPKRTQIGDFDADKDVDLEDYTVFASSWLVESGQPSWNPKADMAYPQDDMIDMLDLSVLAQNWLACVE